MSTSSTRTNSPQTNLRNVRKLLRQVMEAADQHEGNDVPVICQRVRQLREKQVDEDGKVLSQEKAAQRLSLSLKAYRAYELFREPSRRRLRDIALAFGETEDYFERLEINEEVREVVREELSPLLEALRRLEKRLPE